MFLHPHIVTSFYFVPQYFSFVPLYPQAVNCILSAIFPCPLYDSLQKGRMTCFSPIVLRHNLRHRVQSFFIFQRDEEEMSEIFGQTREKSQNSPWSIKTSQNFLYNFQNFIFHPDLRRFSSKSLHAEIRSSLLHFTCL